MSKTRSSRGRFKKRQAVHQTMHPAPGSASSRKVGRFAAIRAKLTHSRQKSLSQPLLTLIPQLLLASINVNGLCSETEWAVSSLLEEHHYDVSFFPLYPVIYYFCYQVLCLSETHGRLESPTTLIPPSGYSLIEATY